MKTSFVDFLASDGVKLQGLLFEPEGKKDIAVIHIHGMAGSFYENTFIPVMAKNYTDAAVAFLTFNNRGHDYLCDLVKITSTDTTSLLGGAAYEIIEESLFDIEGAISFIKKSGYNHIILQGHSSGANKIVYSMSRKQFDVVGVTLLSPCDDIGLHIDEVGDKRNELMKLAESNISAGTPETLMPENTFFSYWLSAKTYQGCFKEGSSFDVFPYRDSSDHFSIFNTIEFPIFIAFGTDGEYLKQSPEAVHQILEQKKSTRATLSFNVIDGASHSYVGKEDILVTKILSWLKQLHG